MTMTARTYAKLALYTCALACGLLLGLLLCSCTTSDPAPLPTCPEIGCPLTMPLICTREGLCSCPQNDGEPAEKCTTKVMGPS